MSGFAIATYDSMGNKKGVGGSSACAFKIEHTALKHHQPVREGRLNCVGNVLIDFNQRYFLGAQ
jgi:hypothetical protein